MMCYVSYASQPAYFHPKYHQGKIVMQFFFLIVTLGCSLKSTSYTKIQNSMQLLKWEPPDTRRGRWNWIISDFPIAEWQKFSVPLVSPNDRNKTACTFKSYQYIQLNKNCTNRDVSFPLPQAVTLSSVFAGLASYLTPTWWQIYTIQLIMP